MRPLLLLLPSKPATPLTLSFSCDRPVLLGCDVKGKQRAVDGDEAYDAAAVLAALPERDDERQVRLDIARSLVNYPQGASSSSL